MLIQSNVLFSFPLESPAALFGQDTSASTHNNQWLIHELFSGRKQHALSKEASECFVQTLTSPSFWCENTSQTFLHISSYNKE